MPVIHTKDRLRQYDKDMQGLLCDGWARLGSFNCVRFAVPTSQVGEYSSLDLCLLVCRGRKERQILDESQKICPTCIAKIDQPQLNAIIAWMTLTDIYWYNLVSLCMNKSDFLDRASALRIFRSHTILGTQSNMFENAYVAVVFLFKTLSDQPHDGAVDCDTRANHTIAKHNNT